MLGLAMPDDPEPGVSAHSPPQTPSSGPEHPSQGAELTASSRLVPNPTPLILNRSIPPAQSSNDMQVDQMRVPLPDPTPVKEAPPLSNSTPSTIELGKGPAPVSEPPQPSSWNSIGFVGDEDEEEEEEIPSINMDSDSD
jgi:hypothetical protein